MFFKKPKTFIIKDIHGTHLVVKDKICSIHIQEKNAVIYFVGNDKLIISFEGSQEEMLEHFDKLLG